MSNEFGIKECRRCGACCRNGGPALHTEDRFLLEEGPIRLQDLVTIRKGEPARDQIQDRIVPVASDIVKIKGKDGFLDCRFFDSEHASCTIYQYRPLECRVLKCWDTRKIEAVYQKNRLTRKDILKNAPMLWELVKTHSEKVDYKQIIPWVEAIRKHHNRNALNSLKKALDYDDAIRDLVVKKSFVSIEIIDFLFGRPLPEVLERLKLIVMQENNRYVLKEKL